MLYHWFELGRAASRPAHMVANSYRLLFSNPFNPLSHTAMGRSTAAAAELLVRTTQRYHQPDFGLSSTVVDGKPVNVTTEIVLERPFCRIIRFRRDMPAERRADDPRVLLVAPMSGHFSTLLRGTVKSLLPDHEVYITDWVDARMVPMSAGQFDLDSYIDYMIELFKQFEGDVHVVAVCQPSVPVLAAVARMAVENDDRVPNSMTLMGGPVDTRKNPTAVNELAEERGTDWFRHNVITRVPWPHAGMGRKVYPGFVQLSGFMSMNINRHMTAQKDLFLHLANGDGALADKHKQFYDEYLAVMDLTEEFYLQTIDKVFVEHELPKGKLTHHGKAVCPQAIGNVALFTVEGGKDDITGRGQCSAAHDICSGLAKSLKQRHVESDAGHYGIFSGSKFRSGILPKLKTFVRRHDTVRSDRVQSCDAFYSDGGAGEAAHGEQIARIAIAERCDKSRIRNGRGGALRVIRGGKAVAVPGRRKARLKV